MPEGAGASSSDSHKGINKGANKGAEAATRAARTAAATEKAPEALRTISEVSVALGVPQHVLRFWETKFPQLRPLQKPNGRRYYRPQDVALLRRIRTLLRQDGYAIAGAQRALASASDANAPAAAPAPEAGSAGFEAPPEACSEGWLSIRARVGATRDRLRRALDSDASASG